MSMNRPSVDRRAFVFGAAAGAGAMAAQPAVLAKDFADAGWQKVTLPHSNAFLSWHSFDEREFQFVSAYRRQFRAPAAFVDFEEVSVPGRSALELEPDRKTFAHLQYPPFMVDISDLPLNPWGDLKIEGYVNGKLAKTLVLSGSGKDAELKLLPDDKGLLGDGRDATRLVMLITDEYGNIRPFATGAIALSVTGPGELVGENPHSINGGAGAVWVKAREAAGTISITAKHPYLGTRSVQIQVRPAPAEAL